jgi:regulatory protein
MAAVAFLARRDYACGELAGKLRERGYDTAIAQAVITDLAARRLLDDARYALHFVEYHRARGQGPVRIRRDLEAFAVADTHIEEALAAVPDWSAVARDVRRRRFGADAPTDWSEKGRQARFLQYRGFSNDHIRSALGPDLELDS